MSALVDKSLQRIFGHPGGNIIMLLGRAAQTRTWGFPAKAPRKNKKLCQICIILINNRGATSSAPWRHEGG